MTSFYFNNFCKDPISKYSHIPTRLQLQHMNSEGDAIQSITAQKHIITINNVNGI